MKKLTSLLLAFAIIFCFTGCSLKDTDKTEETKKAGKEKTEQKETDEDEEDIDVTDWSDQTEPTEISAPSMTHDYNSGFPENSDKPIPTPDPNDPDQAYALDYSIRSYYNSMSQYVDNGDIVMDDITGLVWQKGGWALADYFVTVIDIEPDSGFDELKASVDEFNEEMLNGIVESYIAGAEASLNSGYGSDMYMDGRALHIYRSDSMVLSFNYTLFNDTSTFMPIAGASAYNFDSQTGELIDIKSLCTNYKLLYDCLIEEIENNPPEDLRSNYEDILKEYFTTNQLNFVLTYEGIALIFPRTTLCDYYKETIINIPYKGNEDIFNKDYWSNSICNKCIQFEDNLSEDTFLFSYTLDFDTNQDGIMEHYEVYPEGKDNYFEFCQTAMILSYNGNVLHFPTVDVVDDGNPPYLVIKNGKLYIHHTMWDYNNLPYTTYVFEIIGDDIEFRGTYDGTPECFANSDMMINMTPFEVIGKNWGFYQSHINDEGIVEFNNDYHIARQEIGTIYTLKEISGIDISTNEEAFIPPYSSICFYGSDDKTFVDFFDEEGRIIRVDYEPGDPGFINGMDMHDCFSEEIFGFWFGDY